MPLGTRSRTHSKPSKARPKPKSRRRLARGLHSIHGHGQLHLHRLHGLPLLQRWAGRLTKRFQLKTSATYKELVPLFPLGHINLQT